MGTELTKQEIKSALTRKKLLEAAVRIIQEEGMSKFNVRNVCAEAGLTTGAFYHLFDSKEDLVNYYLQYVFAQFEEDPTVYDESLPASQKVRNLYRFMIGRYEEAGWEFMRAFYTPENNMLNFRDRPNNQPVMLERICEYLEQGQREGTIRQGLDFNEVKLQIAMIPTGVMFYWCVFKGDLDAKALVDQRLVEYLSTIEVHPE